MPHGNPFFCFPQERRQTDADKRHKPAGSHAWGAGTHVSWWQSKAGEFMGFKAFHVPCSIFLVILRGNLSEEISQTVTLYETIPHYFSEEICHIVVLVSPELNERLSEFTCKKYSIFECFYKRFILFCWWGWMKIKVQVSFNCWCLNYTHKNNNNIQ